MRVFGFGRDQGRKIGQYGSDFVQARLVRTEQAHVSCMYLEPGGRVGRHEAVAPQLFAVVQGAGWVAGADGERVVLGSGEAALWAAGEVHEAGTDTGMVAIVVEGDLVGDAAASFGPLYG